MRVAAARGPRLARVLAVAAPMVAVSALSHAVAGGVLASAMVLAPLALVAVVAAFSVLRSRADLVQWAVIAGASELVFHGSFVGFGTAAHAGHDDVGITHAMAAAAAGVLLSSIDRRLWALVARRVAAVRMLWSGPRVDVRPAPPSTDAPSWPVPPALASSVVRRGPPLLSFA